MAVLAIFTALKKGRESWAKTILLNSNRVVSFMKDEQSPLTKTILYYNLADGERGGTWELQLSHFINTVSTRLFEDETNPYIYMDVAAYKEIGFGREHATSVTQRKWKVNSNAVVWAEDLANGTQSYVYLRKGLNLLRLLTSHTVADLSRAYSRSASLSKS